MIKDEDKIVVFGGKKTNDMSGEELIEALQTMEYLYNNYMEQKQAEHKYLSE